MNSLCIYVPGPWDFLKIIIYFNIIVIIKIKFNFEYLCKNRCFLDLFGFVKWFE